MNFEIIFSADYSKTYEITKVKKKEAKHIIHIQFIFLNFIYLHIKRDREKGLPSTDSLPNGL